MKVLVVVALFAFVAIQLCQSAPAAEEEKPADSATPTAPAAGDASAPAAPAESKPQDPPAPASDAAAPAEASKPAEEKKE